MLKEKERWSERGKVTKMDTKHSRWTNGDGDDRMVLQKHRSFLFYGVVKFVRKYMYAFKF